MTDDQLVALLATLIKIGSHLEVAVNCAAPDSKSYADRAYKPCTDEQAVAKARKICHLAMPGYDRE